MAQVYLLLAGCRVYKGHLQNEWVIKTVREPPKENLSALNPALNPALFMHIYILFVEIQRYLEIPLIDFCETSHIKRQAPKVYVA